MLSSFLCPFCTCFANYFLQIYLCAFVRIIKFLHKGNAKKTIEIFFGLDSELVWGLITNNYCFSINVNNTYILQKIPSFRFYIMVLFDKFGWSCICREESSFLYENTYMRLYVHCDKIICLHIFNLPNSYIWKHKI